MSLNSTTDSAKSKNIDKQACGSERSRLIGWLFQSLLIKALMLLMDCTVMFWSFVDGNTCLLHVEKVTLSYDEALEFGYE